MAKTRCRAVCITQNSRLVHARRNHHHEAHWGRFSNRELYTTEHEADVDAHRDNFTITSSPTTAAGTHNNDPKLLLVEF